MAFYKDQSFQDRVARAAEAKKKALEQLRSRPPLDASVVAERQAASARRDQAKAEKTAAKAAAKQAAAAADAVAEVAVPPPPTEAERKAARDARYAARKKRK